ncbi:MULTISPECIES: hypothetical protein [Kordiimonas]|jgi:hypothetical protein|uniref:Uncharacterized protein n=1 Tax=Kordiimonas lacus TaxID=637679 RepID=A0A1G7AWU3_9PROT|nr:MULTISPECIES: hypothetical protein [Kordiimonas]SDE19348.1 hypothetical protein SAMN04488071_2255 [Kordiimonas lacus]
MVLRAVIILAALLVPNAPAFATGLTVADDGTSAGYITLAWPDTRGNSFELKQKTASGWHTLYTGGDRATTLSGLPDGSYEFQLTADGARVGTPVTVTVSHHPLSRAWGFFAVGAFMFIALTAFLVLGGRAVDSDQTAA